MNYFFMTTLYALLLTLIQVSAASIICKNYVVTREGDTCEYIWDKDTSKEYFIRRKELLEINPAIDCENLKPKTKICVAIKKAEYDEYQCKSNDTCKTLAKKTNTDIKILKNINNYIDCESKVVCEDSIRYLKKGNYTPDFSKAKEVSIDPKTKTTTVKKTTKTTKKSTTKSTSTKQSTSTKKTTKTTTTKKITTKSTKKGITKVITITKKVTKVKRQTKKN